MSLNLDKTAWKRVTLRDVVRHVTDRVDAETSGLERFLAGEHIPSGDLAITDWGVIGCDPIGPMFYKRFKPGHVLYVSRRTYLRKVAVPEFEGITGEKTFVLETLDENLLLQEFLPFVLSAERFHAYAIAHSRGSVNPYLNWGELAAYEFDLPPLDEQQRFADLLWALERYRLSIRERAERTWDVVAVVLRHAWEAERKFAIGGIGGCVTGSTPSKANADYWNSEDVPFYTPSEIDGEFIASARQRVSLAGAKVGRMLPKNAVAVACIGGDLGKSAIVTEPGISNQQITSIVGLPADDAGLLQAILSHPLGRAALQARETTTIVRKLNKSDLMKVEVPWPADRRILHGAIRARRMATVGADAEASRLARFRSGLTAEIFGGAE
ncbi:restriction endonuclease subunit S [Streptomyces sp. MCL20-2]|uniref:restriction endonuclease subunit S n=1 Tax=Streptomyces sp. MCL20-2 TaxID=2967219 RepID=UPI0029661634|nr:restriction endonuclease subunit S [Streptomyces sp. MCL20-2]